MRQIRLSTKFGLVAVSAIMLLGTGFTSARVEAQEVLKHPRVVELEDRLNRDATSYIKARFPEIPFMVVVRVDPIRRDVKTSAMGSENLPYFESNDQQDEFRDEWDNPQIPLMGLINRVRRISVKISVPSKLKETEVNEMREGIFEILHLTPARDEIDISRREWVLEEIPWIAVYVAGGLLFTLLFGMLVINRSSANRIAKALTDMKMQNSNSSSGGGSVAPMSLPEPEAPLSRSSGSHEVKFNDPIKMKELASSLIKSLATSPRFPNHHDVFILDRLGEEAPAQLGAILMEFSSEMQLRLFEYSSGVHWVEAMNEPGFLDFHCLEVLQSLAQIDRNSTPKGADRTVLAIWRLGEQRSKFLRSLPREESLAILSEMPKSIAVAEARKAFPGAWGAILDASFAPDIIPELRLRQIHDQAVMVSSLSDLSQVKRYRSDKELLEYVKTVDPAEERDIYEAAAAESLIHRIRPPFYPIFQQNENLVAKVVAAVPIDQWALALFNLVKSDRQIVDRHFTDKQRFLLTERFKRFDAKPPSPEQIGAARERVGRQLGQLLAGVLSEQADVDALLKSEKANAA